MSSTKLFSTVVK